MSDRILFIRTCKADGSAYNGFRWTLKVGAEVRPEKWSPEPECGNGLHGLKWGVGDGSLLDWDADAVWIVFSADPADVVDLNGKSKVRVARVEFVGDRLASTSYIIANGADAATCVGGTATAGDRGTATAGYGGTATAGDGGTATAGDRGTATAGYGGTATAGYGGIVEVAWWDEEKSRMRRAIGYVGEDGIKAGVAYRCEGARLVEVRS